MENQANEQVYSYKMLEAFDLIINPKDSSLGKAGRAWMVLINFIQPALVDTAERLTIYCREELEQKDITDLLKLVQSALLRINKIEHSGDIQLMNNLKTYT